MVTKAYAPASGDIVWLDMNPQAGSEQAGRRPAIVLSPKAYNEKTGLALFCPVTNQKKGFPFEVDIPPGLRVTGVILSDHIKSLDWRSRNAAFLCKAGDFVKEDVLAKISALLGF